MRGFNIENPNANRLQSKLYFPTDVTFAADGRGYIMDWNNHRIRRVEHDDSLRTVVGTDYEGDGPPGEADRLPVCAPAGAPGTTVAMNHVTNASFGPDGKLYIAAWHNNKIRVYDPETDDVTVLAGNGYGYAYDGGPACNALFNQVKAVTVGDDGVVYAIDQRNVRVRAIAPDGSRTITTIAGSGVVGTIGDGGQAVAAQFGWDTGTTPQPSGALALDGRTLYIADTLNNRIRRVNLDTGVIDCIGGTVTAGYSGDGGPAVNALFNNPVDLEIGPDHRLYVADLNNHAIRAIDLTTGIVETVIGGTQCDIGLDKCPNHAPAAEMPLNKPFGVAFDPAGNMYVADSWNHRILKVTQ